MGKTITTAQAAAQLEVTPLRVQQLCRQRRIKGARLVGRVWIIPEDFKVTPGIPGRKPKQGR